MDIPAVLLAVTTCCLGVCHVLKWVCHLVKWVCLVGCETEDDEPFFKASDMVM